MGFFNAQVKPDIDGVAVQYLGEVSHSQKVELMGGAIATLFPTEWQEPFGLVMIESMACGTPVIALNRGSVSEVVAHKQTGFVCESIEQCCQAVDQIGNIQRDICRKHVSHRFCAERMVWEYESLYRDLLSQKYREPSRATYAGDQHHITRQQLHDNVNFD